MGAPVQSPHPDTIYYFLRFLRTFLCSPLFLATLPPHPSLQCFDSTHLLRTPNSITTRPPPELQTQMPSGTSSPCVSQRLAGLPTLCPNPKPQGSFISSCSLKFYQGPQVNNLITSNLSTSSIFMTTDLIQVAITWLE